MAAAGGGAHGCPALLLASGRSILVLELGTSHQGGYSHDVVVHALQKCGIRHIDTAKRYGCESLLQKAVKESDVKQEDLWITCIVEYHPFQRPQELVNYCSSRDTVFEVYCPLAKGEVLTHPSIIHGKEIWQNPSTDLHTLEYTGLTTGEVGGCKNLCMKTGGCFQVRVFDFTIAEDDVGILNGMHDGRPVSWDPSLIVRMKVFDFNLREEDTEFLNTMNINRKLIHLTYPLWKG